MRSGRSTSTPTTPSSGTSTSTGAGCTAAHSVTPRPRRRSRPGRGAERVVTDGPFVELTEQIAGYYDVELPDLDTAIAAGRLLPAAYTVEIRPVTTVEGYESV